MIDFACIRETHSLATFCESRGIVLRRNGSGGLLVGQCPLHDEKSGSFTVYPDGHYHCFGCGAHGDVTDLCAALDGISIGEVATKLSNGTPAPVIHVKPKTVPKTEPCQLSSQELKRMATAAHRLATDPLLIEQIMPNRPEWINETIGTAAFQGDIGFSPDCRFNQFHGPAILFAYSHGIKARWKDKTIRWLCGGPHGELWRQSLMLLSHRTVYITEGETDSLTLLSLGLEEPSESLVLALSGALIMPKPDPFKDRNIVIVPDPGTAGEKSEMKLREVLGPTARSIITVPMVEVVS